VNVGVPRTTYEELFGPAPRQAAGHEVIDTGFDYSGTDTLLPHPFLRPLALGGRGQPRGANRSGGSSHAQAAGRASGGGSVDRGERDDGGVVWTVPVVERIDEPFVASERDMLEGFLDFGRSTLLVKCSGLTGAQLAARALAPSTLSLLGLVRHVTDVERTWFRRRFGAEAVESMYSRPDRPDAAFDEAEAGRAEQDIACLVAEWQAARRAVADLSLEHVFISDRWGPMQLRWAYCHMTSEYDRHNGHADLLRERIDGTTGT
jgi:Protein of unknown function (DUF664)